MRVAQLTDLHIGFERGVKPDVNFVRLEHVLERLCSSPIRPTVVILTGDLAEHGDAHNWSLLAAALEHAGLPSWPIPGNHDDRGQLLRAFPQIQSAPGYADDGFIQYAIDLPKNRRILMLDTLDEERHGGAYCETRAEWLHAELARHPDKPTLIAMHHPPFATGIDWMDDRRNDPWLARFADAIAGHSQIVGITCGHIHRAVFSRWRGISAMVCPSVAPAVAPEISLLDPARPDGRPLILDEPPGFFLHWWSGDALVTHVLRAEEYPVIARFDDSMQSLLGRIFSEHP